MTKQLKFSMWYSKLKKVRDGERARCLLFWIVKVKDIPIAFLARDIEPLFQDSIDNEEEFHAHLKELFEKEFGYKWDDEEEYCVYWFKTEKDLIHTIRKPGKYKQSEEVIIKIGIKG